MSNGRFVIRMTLQLDDADRKDDARVVKRSGRARFSFESNNGDILDDVPTCFCESEISKHEARDAFAR